MVITHHGGQCFKVTFGDLTLAFDPISKDSSLTPAKFGADIALVSKNKAEYNGLEEASYGEKVPFAITGPGEYERSGVVVQGFLTGGFNTIYSVGLEDMTILHLGALSDKALSKEAREAIGEVDILFIPVGGGEVLSSADAHALATSIEPKVIIPMHWSGIGNPKSLEAFLKEEGGADERVEKLTIKKKDAAGKDGAIIVLTP